MSTTKQLNITESFFNFKLYLQGMKRIKVPSIVSLVFLCLLSVMRIVSEYMNVKSYHSDEPMPQHFITTATSSYALLILVLFIIVPMLTLIIFHFLTSRNGSDFYHAIAFKRRAVFFSLLGAVISWTFIIISVFAIVTTTCYVIFSEFYMINILSILIYVLNIFISCTLVASIFALGCSLTGTVFSSLVASLIILFFPRALIGILCGMISTFAPVVSAEGMALLTRYTCNMPITIFVDAFPNFIYLGHSIDYIVTLGSINFSTLYTLIFATAYIIIGAIVYTKRPSEAAGKAASSPKVQFAIRMLIGYSLSLIAVTVVYYYINDADFNSETILSLCIALTFIFFASFVAMFVYELITSKSLRAALKSIVLYPLIIVADTATLLIIFISGNIVMNYTPDASDIDYVKLEINGIYDMREILDPNNDYEHHYEYNDDYEYFYTDSNYYYEYSEDYLSERIDDVEITDKKVIELVTSILEKQVENYKKIYITMKADFILITTTIRM